MDYRPNTQNPRPPTSLRRVEPENRTCYSDLETALEGWGKTSGWNARDEQRMREALDYVLAERGHPDIRFYTTPSNIEVIVTDVAARDREGGLNSFWIGAGYVRSRTAFPGSYNTVDNETALHQCDLTTHFSRSAGDGGAPPRWSCRVCFMPNPAALDACEHCESPR